MALTHIVTSSPAFNQTNVAPAVPSEIITGDHVFMLATAKQFSKDFDPATFGDWSLLWSGLLPYSTTTGNLSAGNGQVRTGVFYRQVPAGGIGTPVIGLTGSGTASAIVTSGTLSVWRSDTGASLDITSSYGERTVTTSSGSAVAVADPGYAAGDTALLFSVETDDAPTFNSFAITATGATFTALAELADAGSALGDDVHVGLHTGTVTAGPATDVPTFTATVSSGTGGRGGTVFLRLREAGGGTPAAPSGAASGAWAFMGGATGTAPALTDPTGFGNGSWVFAGTSSGTAPSIAVTSGSGVGAWSFDGSAVGASPRAGTGAGSWLYAGTASGSAPTVPDALGNGLGVWTFNGAATGSAPVVGSANGVASGAWQFAGQAEGTATRAGTASGNWSFVGSGTGAATRSGVGNGTAVWTGQAVGASPALGAVTGAATGTWAYTGTAAGTSVRAGTANGTTLWAGTALGGANRTGQAAGAWIYAGTAVGRTPGETRDITVTWGRARARALTGTARARTITVGTLED